mgnify:CR=1 FL=1
MSNALMLSLANPQSGREQEYQDWYANRHLGAPIEVPSVLEGKLHNGTDHSPSAGRPAAGPHPPRAAPSQSGAACP